MSNANASAIKVVCRFRPQNRIENDNGGQPIIAVSDDGTACSIDHSMGRQTFSFDRVFDWNTAQQTIYDYAARPIVEDVMRGYNGTIFAYGQTGSGKTFTMQGPDIDNAELRGIIPRIVEHIFSGIMRAPSTIEFTVSVSYLEIYMERIRDLLEPRNDNLPIHEDKLRGVYVKGLRAVYVTSPDETLEVMRAGASNRAVTATNMNEESSRSHSMFLIAIQQKNTVDQSARSGKLYLVDLAGSEMVNKTGATGQTLEEAKKINRSLTSLGMVINALTDGKSQHIPYRDSKLTRILQESLGGNSRTSLVINCSPSSYNEMETISTLRFGLRAKKIENKAKINQELSPAELRRRLERAHRLLVLLRAVVLNMKKELAVWRAGGSVAEDAWVAVDETLLAESLAEVGDAAQDILARAAAAPGAVVAPELAPEAAVAPGSPPTVDMDTSTMASAEDQSASSIASLDDGVTSFSPPTTSTPIPLEPKSPYPEDLLERENELVDQLAQKEAELAQAKQHVESMQQEFAALNKSAEASRQLQGKLNDAQISLEKLMFENRELAINAETLLAEKDELERRLRDAEATIEEMQAGVGKEARMREMMTKMREELGGNDAAKSQADRELKDLVAELDSMSVGGDVAMQHVMSELRKRHQEALAELNANVARLEAINADGSRKIAELQRETQSLQSDRLRLEQKLSQVEHEYEALLDESIQRESESAERQEEIARVSALQSRLEAQFKNTRESQQQQLEDLRKQIAAKTDDLDRTNTSLLEQKYQYDRLAANHDDTLKQLAEAEARIVTLQADGTVGEKDKEIGALKLKMTRQLADFKILQDSLTKDLENRCLKVIELEMLLDDARDQVQTLLRSQDMRNVKKVEAQTKQLSELHSQLVAQNTSLKGNLATAVRKLAAREERIHNLELLLLDFQDRDKKMRASYDDEVAQLRRDNQELRAQLAVISSKTETDYSFAPRAIRGGGSVAQSSPQPKSLKGGGLAPAPLAAAAPSADPRRPAAPPQAAPTLWRQIFSSPSKGPEPEDPAKTARRPRPAS